MFAKGLSAVIFSDYGLHGKKNLGQRKTTNAFKNSVWKAAVPKIDPPHFSLKGV